MLNSRYRESRSENFPPHFVHIFGHSGKVIGIDDVEGLTDTSINNNRQSEDARRAGGAEGAGLLGHYSGSYRCFLSIFTAVKARIKIDFTRSSH